MTDEAYAMTPKGIYTALVISLAQNAVDEGHSPSVRAFFADVLGVAFGDQEYTEFSRTIPEISSAVLACVPEPDIGTTARVLLAAAQLSGLDLSLLSVKRS